MFGKTGVLFRLQVAQAQVFQFPFHLPDTQAVGQRRMHQLGLTRQTALNLGRLQLQAAHQLQALGQDHQDGTHVIGDSQQHPAQILHPALVDFSGVAGRKATDAPDLFDHCRDRYTEFPLDLFGVVALMPGELRQHRSQQRLDIELQPIEGIDGMQQRQVHIETIDRLFIPVGCARKRCSLTQQADIPGRPALEEFTQPAVDLLFAGRALPGQSCYGRDHGFLSVPADFLNASGRHGSVEYVADQAVGEFRFKPGRFRRHDLTRVSHRHQRLHRGRKQ